MLELMDAVANPPWWVWCILAGLAVMAGAVWFDTEEHDHD